MSAPVKLDAPKLALDAATLAHVIALLRDGIMAAMLADSQGSLAAGHRVRGEALDEYHDDLRLLTNHLVDLVTEAESRPPTLADWVAAAEGSKLGAPHPGMAEGEWALYFGRDEAYGPYVVLHDGVAAVYESDRPSRRPTWTVVTTPAELRAALDRLADEGSP